MPLSTEHPGQAGTAVGRVAAPTPPPPAPPPPTPIQRVTEGTSAAPSSDVASSPVLGGPSGAGAASSSDDRVDEDELAERVLRKVVRRLAVEAERRGVRPWP